MKPFVVYFSPVTITEARRILGLGPEEDPRPHLLEFQAARKRIAEMVRAAPNEQLALRYQDGLIEFDQALAAIREHLEALGLALPEAPSPQPSLESDEISEFDEPPRKRSLAWLAWLLVFLTGAASGGILYIKNEHEKNHRLKARIEFLQREGLLYVENRRWQEAAESYAEIEQLDPHSEIALIGR